MSTYEEDNSVDQVDTVGTDIEPTGIDDDTSTTLSGPDDAASAVTDDPTDDERLPVLPGWLRSIEGIRSAVRALLRDWTYRIGFHGLRLPKYYGRLLVRVPFGVWRVLVALADWVRDRDGHEAELSVRAAAASGRSAGPVADLHRQRRDAIYRRFGALVLQIAVVVLLAWIQISNWAWSTRLLAVGLILGLVGWVGRDRSRSIIERPLSHQTRPPLTFTLIEDALEGLGLAAYNKALRRQEQGEGRAVMFVTDVTREKRGASVILDLPRGVTASDVIDRVEEFAGGLRRPESTVWPEQDRSARGHASRLKLYVADNELATLPPHDWPLLKAGRVNLFDGFPIGIDRRGDTIKTCLMFKAAVIGALPRYGKTVALRLLGLAASLDVRTELHWYGLNGGSDGRPFQQIAHAYRVGGTPDDIDYLATDLRAMVTDMGRRYEVIESLDWELCPESKVTDDLASDRRLGLHPVVFLLDECQVAFREKTLGTEITNLIEKLVREGPAVGIIVVLSTQKPDGNSLPTDIRDNASWRLCFRVMGWQANDMVMGDGANAAGISGVKFGPKDQGVGWFAGDDEPQIIRTDFVNGPQAQLIAERARALKVRAGRLTGYAAGDDPNPDVDDRSILDHLLVVWPTGEDAVWCDLLAGRLADNFAVYAGWTGEQVTLAVKQYGIENKGLNRKDPTDGVRRNKRGITLSDVQTAIDVREREQLAMPAAVQTGHLTNIWADNEADTLQDNGPDIWEAIDHNGISFDGVDNGADEPATNGEGALIVGETHNADSDDQDEVVVVAADGDGSGSATPPRYQQVGKNRRSSVSDSSSSPLRDASNNRQNQPSRDRSNRATATTPPTVSNDLLVGGSVPTRPPLRLIVSPPGLDGETGHESVTDPTQPGFTRLKAWERHAVSIIPGLVALNTGVATWLVLEVLTVRVIAIVGAVGLGATAWVVANSVRARIAGDSRR